VTPATGSGQRSGEGLGGLDFDVWARVCADRAERALDEALPGVNVVPARLHEAMRYAVLGGGKRVRPLLVYAAGESSGAKPSTLDAVACAVELIHAYSLVHDDLPCMDNDVLRRGKPTVHVAFGEAEAMLVGDALQALAFEVLGGADGPVGAMVATLGAAAGSRGMAGGQAIDLAAVGARLGRHDLETMHRMKTGALLRGSVLLGAMAGATLSPADRGAYERYADAVGLAFQVVDDILDVEADSSQLGKTAGKDAEQGKPTYVSVLGLDASKALAASLRQEALAAIAPLGPSARRLAELADMIVLRKS
jgi:farnesyl diphosphate synthase